MGRKKNAPHRITASRDGSDYLGIYGHVAANSRHQPTSLEANAPTRDTGNPTASATAESAVSDNQDGTLQASSDAGETSRKKNVNFATDNLITTFETVLPPEIELIDASEADQLDDSGNCQEAEMKPVAETLILRYNYHPSQEAEAMDCTPKIGFRSFHTCVRLEATAPQGGDKVPELPFQIRTSQGARELLNLCIDPAIDPNVRDDKGKVEIGNVGVAVEQGLIHLTICQALKAKDNQCDVVLSLTDYAFDVCSPRVLPVPVRKNSKAYQTALSLQRAFAELFPKDAEMFPLSKQRNGPQSITAKQVYALVDNVQIKSYLKKKRPPLIDGEEESNTTMKIPGLAPTLRPYQEAAVQWMLQRERGYSSPQSSNEEWELSWIVVDASKSQGRIHFLPEYTRHLKHLPLSKRKTSRHQFLFCPFTNWLASSMEEARAMTLLTSVDPKERHDSATIPRGGILAESMGLGKTVEVLACILANPDPRHNRAQINAATATAPPSSSVSLSSESAMATMKDSKQEQGDACDEGGTTEPRKRGRYSLQDSSHVNQGFTSSEHESSTSTQIQQSKENDSIRPVSPSNSSLTASDNDTATIYNMPSSLEERWIDSKGCELGACICGKSISIFPSPDKDSIVLCEGCQEPMHWKCAAFGPEREKLPLLNKGIIFRQKFSHASFWCRHCPSSLCPCCVANGVSRQPDKKYASGATVIVAPSAILCQWEREISRHTLRTLKVVVYTGVKNLCSQQQGRSENESYRLIHPRFLADANIVLMTFDTLHQDLGHSDSNPFAGNGRASLRKRKRYRVVPSPLSLISWWRVCLDEAQRVETPTAGSAQMALKLATQFRWCVSGTPIGRGKLDDLFGLLLFLRLTPPFNNRFWFRQCFSSFENDAYTKTRLQHLLGSVLWRSTKSLQSVALQIGVPPQIEKTTVLKFSSVEKHFYNRQLNDTMDIIDDLNKKKKLSSRKRKGDKSLELLGRQLGKLRAACCHPQVGTSGIVGKKSRGAVKVLSMDQVLDRLIDDARNKCEEALRVSLFHTNPMATIARLKVEARRQHDVRTISESDEFLYSQSCKLFHEALSIADENAAPSLVTEEVVASGSPGFRSPGQSVRGGAVMLGWKLQHPIKTPGQDPNGNQVWACFEYEGQGKKLRQIRVRPLAELPLDLALHSESSSWRLRRPRRCLLQVSNAAVGGEFVDIITIELPRPKADHDPTEEWVAQLGLPIYRSKSWRIVVQSFYPDPCGPETQSKPKTGNSPSADFFGLEVELYEPTIGFDALQRLHTLHNAIISFREFQAVKKSKDETSLLPFQLSTHEIGQRVASMEEECEKIEAYSLQYAKNVRIECTRRLESLISARQDLEQDLLQLGNTQVTGSHTFWDIQWWDDILATVQLNGSLEEQHSVCEKVKEAVDGCKTYDENSKGGEWYKSFQSSQTPESPKNNRSRATEEFPAFRDLQGLKVAMKIRFDDGFLAEIRGGRYHECIMSVLTLSPNPTKEEVLENRVCHVCKAEWFQTGPKCSHCKVEDKLKVLKVDSQKLARTVLEAIWKWARSGRVGNDVRNSNIIRNCVATATKFFETLEVSRKEVLAAARLWKIHLDLLNVMDELDSCKTPMRLVHQGEDLSELSEEQKGTLVVPLDVCARYIEHEVKQATALGNLRHQKMHLSFLKNQEKQQSKSDSCMVCLLSFTSDRAVLGCGHYLHPRCLEFWKQKQKSSSQIRCPLRCVTRTHCKDVMIASDRRSDDGSKNQTIISGNFGTKVNALVGDLLTVSGRGEKSVVFSMWEEMLDILEEALNTNGLQFVRASSLSKIGESTKRFRSSDCFVLLLNVKNGAEGLNLIEATHCFMIEPLLNYGLDSQAVARIHRIGQTQQTFVHRYLIDETIECKIDRYRHEHQGDQLEDAIMDSRKCAIQAGGIDGGFSSKEELMDFILTRPQKDEITDTGA